MNYEIADLSNKDKIIYLLKGSILSMAISYLFYDNLWLGIPIALVYAFTIKSYEKSIVKKRKETLLLQFKDLLYSVSSAISTNRTMAQALEESIDFWDSTYNENDYIIKELRKMVGQIKDLNFDDVLVLQDFANRSGLEDIKNFVLTYKNAKETGANLNDAINHASKIIGDKIMLEKDIKMTIKEKEFEAKIVSLAPFIILLFLRLTSNDYLGSFLHTMEGHFIATISLLLMLLAKIISERIIQIEV